MGGVAALIRRPQVAKALAPAPIMVAPTVAEVSQSSATSADGYDLRTTKAKGRSATIITGSKGIEDQTLTLGKKSLLGR